MCSNRLCLGIFLLLFSIIHTASAQSFELMPGTERIFIDVQFLKYFDDVNGMSLFSRTRATTHYDELNTDLFTGVYLNYTTNSGIGATLLGRIGSNQSGMDIGLHYIKSSNNLTIFASPSVNVNDELLLSWFSIIRYTPTLKADWKLYSSLELFSTFDKAGYLSDLQRIRLGLSKENYQWGFAVNLRDSRFSAQDINPGIFIRREF